MGGSRNSCGLCCDGRLQVRPLAGAAALIAFSLWACRTEKKDPQSAVDATLCAIAAQPTSYDGQLVRLSAHVMSGVEHTVLFDPVCSDAAIVAVAGPPRHTDLHALSDVIFGRDRGTPSKEVVGTFVGTFRSRREKLPNRIELLSASNVVVTAREMKPSSR
jgi:hypothetical protein